MTGPTANDNHRKDVDWWDDEGGGRPPSPERSPRPDPVASQPNPPPIALDMQEDVALRPQGGVGHSLEHTTNRVVAKDVRSGHTHS
jgi:hypothetical protein